MTDHEVLVDRTVDIPEDPERGRPMGTPREATEGERNAGLRVFGVVDLDGIDADRRHLDNLSAELSDAYAILVVGAEDDGLAMFQIDTVVVSSLRLVSSMNALSLKTLQF